MSFDAFGTLIGVYNSSIQTITDGDYGVMSLDVNGRVIVTGTDFDIRDLSHTTDSIKIGDGTDLLAINADGTIDINGINNTVTVDASDLDIRDLTHVSDSIKIGDGVDLLDILTWDVASAGTEKGILPFAVRHDADTSLVGTDGDFAPLQVDSLGRLKVSGSFNVNVDDVFESGVEADACSDDANDGIIAIGNTMTDVVTIPVPAGTTYYITGLDASCDKGAGYELIVDDDSTPTEWIRVGNLSAGSPDIHKAFERAIEVVGGANISLKIRAAVSQGANGNASAAINGYTRT